MTTLLGNTIFSSKDAAREHAWRALEHGGFARPPFPTHGRIPNFAGAEAAAAQLFAEPRWQEVRAIKVNPDTPQLPVRVAALRRGIEVYVPTPKLAGGFMLLSPDRIPASAFHEAATRQTMLRWAVPVSLGELPQLDGIVTGCAAVTRAGKRCGKGAGYSDLELGVLMELGHEPCLVATTVHDVQVVGDFPVESTDLTVNIVCTPTQRFVAAPEPLRTPGLDWSRLDSDQLAAMPILRELRPG